MRSPSGRATQPWEGRVSASSSEGAADTQPNSSSFRPVVEDVSKPVAPSMEHIDKDPAGKLDSLINDLQTTETRRSLEQGFMEPKPVIPDGLLEAASAHNEFYQKQTSLKQQLSQKPSQWKSFAKRAAPVIAVACLALAVSSLGGPAAMMQQATTLSSKVSTYCAANAKPLLSLFTLVTSLYLQISGVPTVLQIHRDGDTGTFSAFPYASMIANCSVWAVFGFMNNSMACLVPNITGLFFGLSYLTMFAMNTKNDMKSTYAGVGTILGGLGLGVAAFGHAAAPAIGAFGAIFCFVLMASPLATVRTVIKTKTTKSMPFPMVVGTFMDSLSWCLLGMIVLKEPSLYLPNIGGLVAAVVQLSLFVIYGFGDEPKQAAAPTRHMVPALA